MLIAFASDYGHVDEFAGVCKAVMLGIAPGTPIVDLGHDIPRHDVRVGALLLVRSVQYLPSDSILLGIVDPGVGTERRLIAVGVEGGFLLGPDNGLLAPAVALAGGAHTVVSLENPEFQLQAPGPTFAGRDILAPAAAHLAAGVPVTDLGPVVDPLTLVPGLVNVSDTAADGTINGEIWWVDHFGNCQLNVDPAELAAAGAAVGDRVEVRVGSTTRSARWVHTYADAKPSEVVVLVDSYGLLSLALDRDSAAQALDLHTGSAVALVVEGAGNAGTR